jgi:3',5'-nucleoside bisphosphate phosphatase
LFALTDHDTCAGTSACTVPNARNVRAVEISCSDADGFTVHVLAFDTGGEWAQLEDALTIVRDHRKNRLSVMGAKLLQRGIKLDLEPLLQEAKSRAVGRPDLAKAMVAAGVVSSIKEAFTRHLFDRGPVDVPHKGLSVSQAVTIARSAGAKLSLAHPHLYGDRAEKIVVQHQAEGLDGIEAYYGRYDSAERKRWLQFADARGLVCTGGSDSHGDPTMARGVDVPDDRGDQLLKWLGLS